MELVDLNLNQQTPAPAPYDGPGSTSDRPVDIGSHDPLVNLGLVDPKTGAALPADDWRPAQAAQVAQPQPQAAPAPAPQPAPQAQPAGSDAGSQYGVQAAILQAQAAQAYAEAVAAGEDAQAAQRRIGSELKGHLAEARAQAIQAALYPAAKAQVAGLIASRQGAGQVRPEELMAYDTPQAMEAAASQLAAARRATSYQQRVTQGTDRSEGTAPARGISPALDALSPEKKIELGIRRGQFG